MPNITHLLNALVHGDGQAADHVLPLVYDELRRLAAQKLRHEPPGQTLNATALVHEAYLRLVGPEQEPCWQSRSHFFAAAAEAMRRILVDNARRKRSQKHGGGLVRHALDDVLPMLHGSDSDRKLDLLDLDAALTRLAELHADKARLVEMHVFAGLTLTEAAETLGIALITAKRHWTFARAWLLREITRGANPGESAACVSQE